MAADPRRVVLVVLCLAQLAFILDVSVVNVALVPLAAELGADPPVLQLVAAVYAAMFGGVLLLGGRLADRGDARRTFVAGLLLFATSSALCGAAPTVWVLVFGRAVQGLGAGLASPAALALLTTTFAEGAARNRALGTWAAVAAVGGAVGLLVGGALTATVGWRAVFLVNVPLVVGIVVTALRAVRPDPPQTTRSDVAARSAVAAGGAVVLAVTGLTLLQYGRIPGGIAALVIGMVLLVVQRRTDHLRPDPLIPPVLLRTRSVIAANVVTVVLSAIVLGVSYFLAVHLQGAVGLGPMATGLAFLPITVVSGVTAVLAARSVQRTGAGTLLAAGMASMAAGCLLLAASPAGPYASVLPGMVLVAAGMGPGFAVGSIAATSGVPAQAQGATAALLSTSTQAGAAVGLAGLSCLAGIPAGRADGDRLAYLVMALSAVLASAVALVALRARPAPAPLSTVPAQAAGCLIGCAQTVTTTKEQ